MFGATAILAVTLSVPFVSVHGLPVATVPTNYGAMRMVIDTGAAHTFFSLSISHAHDTVCIFSRECVPARDANQYVPMFRKLLSSRHPAVDGMVGEDVLSHLESVTIDYKRHVVVFELPQ
jgi:hypothetical protein